MEELMEILSYSEQNCYTKCVYTFLICTGPFIMYSGITKIYYRKTVGHVFTKPVQIEETTTIFFFPVSCLPT